MFFIENRLENKIIEKLAKGSVYSPTLIDVIARENNVTEQGVYKALSFLVDNEIVTRSNKLVSLHTFWIEKLKNFTNQISETYNTSDFENFLMLEDKEKLTYKFNDTSKLNVHWMHIILQILKRFSNMPLVIYNPHCWFIIDRPDTESAFFDWINKNNRMMLFLIGGTTELDRKTRKQIETKNIKIELDTGINFPKDRYIAIIGDYIIHTSYGKEFNDSMDVFFKHHTELNKDITGDFREVLNKNNNSKIVIERNRLKAIKLSKQITKNHYIPLDIKGKMF
jgi:23S rRNA pseudoU1915 N3-methylase RlmH